MTAEPRAPAAIPMVHLAIRFLLELVCLGSLGWWGWRQGSSTATGLLWSLACMVPAAAVWGVFRTPGEPAGGKPVIAVPGWIRLVIELAFFALASAALWSAWSRAAAETLMTVLILHAAVTWD